MRSVGRDQTSKGPVNFDVLTVQRGLDGQMRLLHVIMGPSASTAYVTRGEVYKTLSATALAFVTAATAFHLRKALDESFVWIQDPTADLGQVIRASHSILPAPCWLIARALKVPRTGTSSDVRRGG